MKSTLMRIVLTIFAFAVCNEVFATIELPKFFTDNMVLQRQTEAAIWGKAAPGKEVRVATSWNKKIYLVKAEASGRWLVKVSTPEAGGPYSISISDGKEVRLNNILIGEVWLCSGQSNMEMPLAGWGKVNNYEQEIADAKYPQIRLLTITKTTSTKPLADDVKSVGGDGWQECSPQTIENFSSTAYFFGRKLFKELNVPIGLINSSWGGTILEAWMSGETLSQVPDFKDAVADMQAKAASSATEAENARRLEEWNQTILAADEGFKGLTPVWAALGFDDSGWEEMNIPGVWENGVHKGLDGLVWFRKTVEIPEQMKGEDLEISLDMIDDEDITYFNGVKIGETKGYAVSRKYVVPKKLVKTGKNVITVRVNDTGGDGGLYGSEKLIYLSKKGAEQAIPLAGAWKYKVAVDYAKYSPIPKSEDDTPNRVTVLYNSMINPLKNMAIRGAIWYQGESNVGRAEQYKTIFPLMIEDWRKAFNNDFPFYYVQLANYLARQPEPAESAWAELRDAQLQTRHLEHTGMAVIIDIGDAKDIHPKNKQDVGLRLALIALAKTYGQTKTAYSGPVYSSFYIAGNTIRISFKHGKGLNSGGGALKGFAIAGPDGKFHWADAQIDDDEVVVSSPAVEFPKAVRYGWADNPECNLYNGDGLPASPFKTDFRY
ncbi:MAG: 9-O-acetylesterase [Dysgonamonadaceae bacterium]|jgi:sialate O-acetylesterase|nr:9-O-acetylesterase [Dysgonamonadaceae bacterium]